MSEQKWTSHVLIAIAFVKDYIEKHPVDDKSIGELAKMAGVSRNILQKAFKDVYGVQIGKYRRHCIMDIARGLLEKGTPIKAIAIALQYASHSAFTTAFKNHFGLPPTEWQNRYGAFYRKKPY